MAKKSHLGAGLLIGTMIGVAAGFFLKSKGGKQMMKDAERKGRLLQAKLMKDLKNVTSLSKKNYEQLVDRATAYYVKSKEITKKDVPEVRRFMMRKWKDIQREMKAMK